MATNPMATKMTIKELGNKKENQIKNEINGHLVIEKKNNFKKINLIFVISLYIFLLISAIAFAIPNSLTLQGKLTNLAGVSQSGTFNFTFKIYDAATGGNLLWELPNYNITTDANGIYDVILGNINLSFADQYYLGITVGTDNESLPRVNLTSSPYSFRANTSEALNPNASYFVNNLSISGNATIGTGSTTLSVSTQTFNLTTIGSISLSSNITLGDQIKFKFGQIIDNLADGWLKLTGSLNVTSGLVVGGNFNVTSNVTFIGLKNCNTIDTDANGLLTCGSDSGADAAAWNLVNYSNEYANSGYKLANYSTEYSNTGYKVVNFTANYQSRLARKQPRRGACY